eukprot:jgi/Ulvmu1/5279/UM022_0073.1
MPSKNKPSSLRPDNKRREVQDERNDRRKKKRRADEETGGEEQQVEFDFCDPADGDFHIIKALVSKLDDGNDFDSSAMSDLIISDAQISSSIRCDADCIGFAALLPLSVFKDSVPLKQLTAYWRKRAKGTDCEDKLGAVLESDDAAVMTSERVVNAPAELATPLIAGIVGEQQQCIDSGDAELLPHGNVKHVLHCALAYIDSGAAPSELGAVPVTSGHAKKTEGSAGEVVFVRPEDEFMHARAKWSCQWEVPQAGRYSEHSKRVRVLMALTPAGLKKALADMAQTFNHDLAQHGIDV